MVGIASGCGLDGPGMESRRVQDVPHLSDRSWGLPSLLYNGYWVFPGGKEGPGRDADPSPLLVPCSRNSRAIPLLPVWAVRPVQILSACTRVHFTVTLPQWMMQIFTVREFENVSCSMKLLRKRYCNGTWSIEIKRSCETACNYNVVSILSSKIMLFI